jgi:hypothetical protein
MVKILVALGVIALIVFAAISIFPNSIIPLSNNPSPVPSLSTKSDSFDFGNQKIMLSNQELAFVNGTYKSSDTADSGHSATIDNQTLSPSKTRAAAILIDNPGGSGTFYYLIAGMQKDGMEIYSEPVSLGDRIKIVSVTVEDPEAHDNGEIVVVYLDRAEGAPMAEEPTQQVTKKYSFLENGNLIEVLH